MMKNASRSKFLLCFRPLDDDDDMEIVVEAKPARRARTKLSENPKLEKTNKVNEVKPPPPLIKTMSLDRDCSTITQLNPSRHNRTLSKAFKAIFFGTILTKKARDGKVLRQQHSLGSERDYVTQTPSETSSDDVSVDSSHASSKQSSKNHQECVKKKSKKSEKGSSCDFNLGMCLLLMSIGITVFWGRVFAILFTSIWLYVFSWSCTDSSDIRRPEKAGKWSEEEFREQKRRVIMEGLIERNHHSQTSQRWY